jgi:hypothetical protein
MCGFFLFVIFQFCQIFACMPNQDTTKKANQSANRLKAKITRGVTMCQRMDRRGQWQVMWIVRTDETRAAAKGIVDAAGGKPKRRRPKRKAKLFPTREQAIAFAAQLSAKIRDHGMRVLNFDPSEWQRWCDFRREIDGAEISEILAVWREHVVRQRRAAVTVSVAIAEHLRALELEGVDAGHYGHVELHLQRLSDYFGANLPLNDVSAGEIREWLAVLADDGDGGEGFAAETVKHHLKSARALFRRGWSEHWVSESPTAPERVKPPKVVYGEKLALSIKEARTLFGANRDFRVCGLLALEAFAGVRFSGATRLREEDVNWRDKLIILPDIRHKSDKRFVLDDVPKNLWAWLKHAAKIDGFWEVTSRQYNDEKAAAFARAGVENPGNVLRRSHCSWGIALDGNAARVAARMQHASPATLYRQYRSSRTKDGYVTKREAPQWELIVP